MGNIGAFPIHEYWLDIGRKNDFDRAQSELKIYFEKSNNTKNFFKVLDEVFKQIGVVGTGILQRDIALI